MIYLIWSVLNLAALVWFLFIAFSVLKPVRESLGTLSAIIFVVCCLSFIKSAVMNKPEEIAPDPAIKEQRILTEKIHQDLFYSIDLIYVYSKDVVAKDQIRGTTVKSGLVVGHAWKPLLTSIYYRNGMLQYQVSGNHEWTFLGLTLHQAPEEFKGVIKAK
jgi:hypothetical protein